MVCIKQTLFSGEQSKEDIFLINLQNRIPGSQLIT